MISAAATLQIRRKAERITNSSAAIQRLSFSSVDQRNVWSGRLQILTDIASYLAGSQQQYF
jgi:hypothetical protein